MVDVVVCVVHYLNEKLTLECLDSIKKSNYDGVVHPVVYANSPFNIEGREGIHVLSSDNVGYAGAGAKAYQQFRDMCKYFILLNNDLVVSENWLRNMVKYMEFNPAIAIAGCKVVSSYGEHNRGSWSLVCENVDSPAPEPFYVSGTCMIVRTEAVDELFDPDYFLWGEDVYACWRQRLQGRKIGVCWDAVVGHEQSYSIRRSVKPLKLETIGERNKLWLIFSFYEKKTILKILPLLLVWLTIKTRRLKGFLAFLLSIRKVMNKRGQIQKTRTVRDEELIRLMTCKLSNHNQLVNQLAKIYCKQVGLKTLEI